MDRLTHYGKTTFASLTNRNYRLYFIGQAISLSGTWAQVVAQGLLVLTLTHSGTALGLIIALQFLPILLFGAIGGVIVDRFPKQKILYITQFLSALLALILGILVLTHVVQVWMVGVLATCLGLTNAVDNPTRQTFAADLVGKETLPNAITLNSWEINIGRVIGPIIAGVLVATVGLAVCFLFNSVSFLAVLLVLSLMDTKKFHLSPIAAQGKRQLQEGFSYVAHSPILRNTLFMLALVGTLTYEFQVSLPLVARDTFHNPTWGYTLLNSSMGIGAVIGGLIVASRKKNTPAMLIVASVVFGLSLFFVAFSPTLLIAMIGMVLVGISSISFNSIGNSSLQMESVPEMRGRVMSLWTVALLGSTPIGGPIIGWVGEHIGPRFGLGVGAVAALLAAGIGLVTMRQIQGKRITEGIELENLEMQAESRMKTN